MGEEVGGGVRWLQIRTSPDTIGVRNTDTPPALVGRYLRGDYAAVRGVCCWLKASFMSAVSICASLRASWYE